MPPHLLNPGYGLQACPADMLRCTVLKDLQGFPFPSCVSLPPLPTCFLASPSLSEVACMRWQVDMPGGCSQPNYWGENTRTEELPMQFSCRLFFLLSPVAQSACSPEVASLERNTSGWGGWMKKTGTSQDLCLYYRLPLRHCPPHHHHYRSRSHMLFGVRRDPGERQAVRNGARPKYPNTRLHHSDVKMVAGWLWASPGYQPLTTRVSSQTPAHVCTHSACFQMCFFKN